MLGEILQTLAMDALSEEAWQEVEAEIKEKEETARVYLESSLEMLQENPGDPIGHLGVMMAAYEYNRPLYSWDHRRLKQIAAITQPLMDMMQQIDPEASFESSIDPLLGQDAIFTIRSGPYADWHFTKRAGAALAQALCQCESYSFNGLLEEKISLSLRFAGAKRAVSPNMPRPEQPQQEPKHIG